MLADSLAHVDPLLIQIRSDRQRREVNSDDLLESIRARGILNPLIISGDMTLVAGERRLSAALRLELALVPVRFVEQASEVELQIIELEENVKRTDLSWQDQAQAVLRIHLLLGLRPSWSLDRTADYLGISPRHTQRHIMLAEALADGDPNLASAQTAAAAYTILERRRTRAADEAVSRIFEEEPSHANESPSASSLSSGSLDVAPSGDGSLGSSGPDLSLRVPPRTAPAVVVPSFEIRNSSALDFFRSYSGPRFNLLHCDFPYGVDLRGQANQGSFEGDGYDGGEDIYWELLAALVEAWPRIMLSSAHLVFWISMKHYERTKEILSEVSGLQLNPTPLVWHKTDNRGILPDARRMPRQIYEAALLGSCGDRFLVKPLANVYGCPTGKAEAIHTNEKPEPMLAHFLGMLVDEHTRGLDPTCGSGSAIRAIERLGAESGLGLELNPEFATRAEQSLRSARGLRALHARQASRSAGAAEPVASGDEGSGSGEPSQRAIALGGQEPEAG